jgi:hypothetical protein
MKEKKKNTHGARRISCLMHLMHLMHLIMHLMHHNIMFIVSCIQNGWLHSAVSRTDPISNFSIKSNIPAGSKEGKGSDATVSVLRTSNAPINRDHHPASAHKKKEPITFLVHHRPPKLSKYIQRTAGHQSCTGTGIYNPFSGPSPRVLSLLFLWC